MNCLTNVCLLAVCVGIAFASVCDEITWVTRKEWGAREPTVPEVNMTLPIHHVFIHHTDEPDQCHSEKACVAAVKGIQEFHINTRNFGDIGYNHLLGGDGRIYVGRDWYVKGRHTLGINDKAIALSLIGNFDKVSPPDHMLELAKKWIRCSLEKVVDKDNYQLHGHRDQTCTTCPGDALYSIIKHWDHFKGGKLDTWVCNKNFTTIL